MFSIPLVSAVKGLLPVATETQTLQRRKSSVRKRLGSQMGGVPQFRVSIHTQGQMAAGQK